MSAKATNGVAMSEFEDGDLPEALRSIALTEPEAIAGTWEDIKEISESSTVILEKLGIGLIKRKAITMGKLRIEIKHIETDKDGNPKYSFKTFYPLNITKETCFTTDGTITDQPDKDTCDWKCLAAFCDGRVVQKRTGKKGHMYDTRAVFAKHPLGVIPDVTPIMGFNWTFIDTNGNKYQAMKWLKKVS